MPQQVGDVDLAVPAGKADQDGDRRERQQVLLTGASDRPRPPILCEQLIQPLARQRGKPVRIERYECERYVPDLAAPPCVSCASCAARRRI